MRQAPFGKSLRESAGVGYNGAEMGSNSFTNLCLIGLILLLGIQLTGLSCLDEWRSVSLHPSPALVNKSLTAIVDVGQRGDDGCPCHLAFLSVPQTAPECCYPILLLDIEAPTTLVLDHSSLPFHPPLTL